MIHRVCTASEPKIYEWTGHVLPTHQRRPPCGALPLKEARPTHVFYASLSRVSSLPWRGSCTAGHLSYRQTGSEPTDGPAVLDGLPLRQAAVTVLSKSVTQVLTVMRHRDNTRSDGRGRPSRWSPGGCRQFLVPLGCRDTVAVTRKNIPGHFRRNTSDAQLDTRSGE